MIKLALVAAALSLLAGCGGGGSSDNTGTGSGTGTGGGTPPTGNLPLAINADNALYIASITTISNDTLVSLAQLAVLAHDQLNQRPLKHSAERQPFCRNAEGRSDLLLRTTNDNFYLGPNQRFTINFEDCELAELEGRVTGQLDVTIQAVQINTYALEMSSANYALATSNLNVVDEEGRISLSLTANLQFNGSDTRSSFNITAGQTGLNFTLPDNKIEQWRNFNTTLQINLEQHRYQLQTSGTLQSELLGGNISVSTNSALSGKLQRLPDRGEIRYQAGTTSTMLLASSFIEDRYQALITLPELGLQGSDDWLEFSTGASWQKTGLSKNYGLRSANDFVNLEFERLGPGVSLDVTLLPQQNIVLHFSDVIERISSWSTNLSLRPIDEQGFGLFGVPDIPVVASVNGSIVTLFLNEALIAGIRYRFDGIVAHRLDLPSANIPAIYVSLRDELAASITTTEYVMRPNETVEFVAEVRSDGYDYETFWSSDNILSAGQKIDKNRFRATFSPLGDQTHRFGSINLEVANVRGNSLSLNLPFVVLSPDVENYFYHTSIGSGDHLSSAAYLQLFNVNEDIGNATGIYTLVSGRFIGDSYWGLTLRTGEGDRLQPGTYTLAATPTESGPLIELDFINRRCTPLSGQFTIDKIHYDDELPFVTALAVTYDYQCQSNQDRYRYRGQLKYQRGF